MKEWLSDYSFVYDEFLLADGNEAVNNLTCSKLQTRLGVNEKLALLQRAEENFYQNKDTDKQVYLQLLIPTLFVKDIYSPFSPMPHSIFHG